MLSRFIQIFVVILCGLLLWVITAQINHHLAVWHMGIFTGGLMLAYPALRFRSRHIWRVALPLGLWMDAASAVSAVPFGTHAALFVLAGIIIHQKRGHKPRADTATGVIAAVLSNAVLFIAVSIVPAFRVVSQPGVIVTLLVNLVASSVFVVLVAPWFFALQTRALALAGIGAQAQAGQIRT